MALRHLSLLDFVIVSRLDLGFNDGFSVLTGETGAGKSILVDALQLVLGGRGDALWVRQGQPRCDIGAEFDVSPDARAWLEVGGFADEGADTVLMRRTIDASGKSRAWINGTPATATQLRELGQWLVDIHGQHAWQSLTRPAAVRQLLDAYAGIDTSRLTLAWQDWQQALSAWQQAQAAQQTLASERERLLWQISELEPLNPRDHEWETLNQEHSRLSNAQGLIDAAQAASAALQSDEGQTDALSALAQAQEALQTLAQIEPEFTAQLELLQACEAQAQDVARSLHAYWRRAEPDPAQLTELDQRIGQWVGLARRYRRTPEELPALLAGWRTELARLDAATDLTQLHAAVERTQADYAQEAREISALRSTAAPRLAAAVTAAMQELGMAGGVFEAQLERLQEPTAHGLENIRFLVSAHTGSAPRAIDRVASGGELSRLALAIAVTTSTLGPAATLVFDEVDSGVGGAVAETVGRLLHRLGKDRQVLCVTHLPQVAAHADHHFLVHKESDASGTTLSHVVPIAAEARTQEIARMLGGERISATTLAHARELLGHERQPPVKESTPARTRKSPAPKAPA